MVLFDRTLLVILLVALGIGLLVFPLFIWWQKQRNVGQKIKKEGPNLHLHKENTPSMGGIVICGSILFAFLGGKEASVRMLPAVVLLLSFTFLGFFDDFYKSFLRKPWGLKARYKFLFQLLFACLVVWWSLPVLPHRIAIPFTDLSSSLPPVLFFGYAVFILIASSNALNISDGLDGLAGGSGVLTFLFWGILLFLSGEANFSRLAFAVCGALLAFLWFNAWPARIFMGDSGSLGLGALMGYLALVSGQSLLIILCGIVFVVDTVSVILQVFSFKMFRKRIFLMSPLHHHFELKGIKETQITVRFCIIQVIGVILAFLGRSGG